VVLDLNNSSIMYKVFLKKTLNLNVLEIINNKQKIPHFLNRNALEKLLKEVKLTP
jgi:hypothetical protein